MNRRGRPALSAPCSLVLSTTKDTLTPGSAALMATPSACVRTTVGIVMDGSAPLKPGGGLPATLLAMITPVAPASWAFLVLIDAAQMPRSTSAILPAMAEALVNGVQPSVVDGPASFASSRPRTTLPPKLPGPAAGPNDVVPCM